MPKPLGHAWRKLRAEVLAESGGVCALCGGLGANSVDHIVSRIERPDLELVKSNCQAAHTSCNSRKEIQRRHRPPRRQW